MHETGEQPRRLAVSFGVLVLLLNTAVSIAGPIGTRPRAAAPLDAYPGATVTSR